MRFSSVGEDRKFVLTYDAVGLRCEQSPTGEITDLFICEDPNDKHTRINYKYTFKNIEGVQSVRNVFVETTAPVTVATYDQI